MNRQKPTDVRNLVVLAVLTLLASVYFGEIPYTEEPYASQDLSHYLQAAVAAPNLDPTVDQPFAFRILGPYLVGLLPVPEPLGFSIITVLACICAACLFYYLLRFFGVSAAVSFVVVILALLNRYVFGILLYNNFQVGDALSFVFLILLFLTMWGGRWPAFGVVLALGSLTREVTILMVPVAFIYLLERRELAAKWRQVAAAVVPGTLIFVGLRVFMPSDGGRSLFEALATYSYKLYSPPSLFRGLVNTFLPFTLVPLVFFGRTVAFFKNRLYLLSYPVLVYLSTTFGKNEERLVAPAFIVFFLLLAFIIDGVRAKRLTLFVLLAAGFLTSLHHSMGVWLLPSSDWTRALALGSGVGVTLYMFFLSRTERLQGASAATGGSNIRVGKAPGRSR